MRPPTSTAAPPVRAAPLHEPPAPATGAPDAGARIGHDVATAPALPASAPRLNLELVRPRGGELSAHGQRAGLLPALPRPPELPTKLAKDLEKSQRPDCRNAYAGSGLAAAVPLAVDAVKGDGCRW